VLSSIRVALAAVAVAAGATTCDAANADPYRWCAIYSGDLGGVVSCYFNTWEQCQATVSGVGGHCIENPSYSGPGARRPSPRRARS
jgi:hypothetical protein